MEELIMIIIKEYHSVVQKTAQHYHTKRMNYYPCKGVYLLYKNCLLKVKTTVAVAVAVTVAPRNLLVHYYNTIMKIIILYYSIIAKVIHTRKFMRSKVKLSQEQHIIYIYIHFCCCENVYGHLFIASFYLL